MYDFKNIIVMQVNTVKAEIGNFHLFHFLTQQEE